MHFLLLCFLLLIGLPTPSLAERVPVNADIATLPLSGFLYASPAETELASPREALSLYRKGGFERLPGYLGRGFQKKVAWLGFDIEAATDAPGIVIVDIAPAYLDEVRAYQVDAAGTITPLGRAGDQVPIREVKLRGLRAAFPIHPTEGATILLEIRTSSTQAAIVKLHSQTSYLELRSTEALTFGALAAINLVMIMGALTLYLLSRDPAFLVWMAYVPITFIQWLSLDGLLYLYSPWQNLSNLNLLTNILSVLLFALGGLLMTTLFQFKQIHPWLHRIFVGWALVMVIPLLAIPFHGAWVVGILGKLGLPLYPLGIAAIVIQMVRGHAASRLYGPLYIIHVLGSLINVLAVIGHISFSEFTLYGWQLTNFLNLVSLQISMFMRLRQQLHENETQRRFLMNQLSKKNAELENQVTQRTASLAQALRDVQQAESEQRQLLSMASHEFRTPAAMIKTSLDSLRFLSSKIPREVTRRLTNIEHASTRLIRLSNTLIHQDRLRELALHPKLERVDLQALVEEVVGRYASSADNSLGNIEFDLSRAALQPDGNSTLADPALVSIALHNLIDNALRYGRSADSTKAPAISIGLAVQADTVELQVADRGPGIPDSDKGRIFQRFHTLTKKQPYDDPNPARSNGDGIGLSIVRAIAMAHGGGAYATDNPGGGAVLVIRLPKNGGSSQQ